MKKLQTLKASVFLVMALIVASPAYAVIIPVDLNDFYAGGPAWVSPSGDFAVMVQDGYLSNNPSFGDPGIAVPVNSLSLSFDYLFAELFGVGREFHASLYDGTTGDPIGDEFVVSSSGFGHYAWDLALMAPATTLLGLDFFMVQSGFRNSLSFAAIGNLQFQTGNAAPVPEPATLILLGTGLLGLASLGRRKILK